MSHGWNLPSNTWTSYRRRTTRRIAMDQARMAVTESGTNTWTSCCLQVCSTVYTNSTTVTHLICRTPPTLRIWSAFYFVAVPESESAVSQSKKITYHLITGTLFYLTTHIITSLRQIWRSWDRALLLYSFKYNHQDATLYNILYYCQCSTCCRRFLRPSSGAQKLYTQHRVYAKLSCCYR